MLFNFPDLSSMSDLNLIFKIKAIQKSSNLDSFFDSFSYNKGGRVFILYRTELLVNIKDRRI